MKHKITTTSNGITGHLKKFCDECQKKQKEFNEELVSQYVWIDKTEDGKKNPRAIQRTRMTDKEYLMSIGMNDNNKKLSMLNSSIGVNKENL